MDTHLEKFNKIGLKYKVWLESEDGESIFGDGKYLLLKTIDAEGSFVAATKKLGLSYRKTWNKLQNIEKKLGFLLVETTRGGATGGCSVLSAEAKKMIAAFENFHTKTDEIMNNAFKEFHNELMK